MNKVVLLTVVLILMSCSQHKSNWNAFDYSLTKDWIFAQEIADLKVKDQEITRPPGALQLILSLLIPGEGGLSLSRHCVYYKVPYKQTLGTLSITKNEGKESCPEIPQEKIWMSLEDVSHLTLSYNHFQLVMKLKWENTDRVLSLPLVNVREGKSHKKFSPEKEKSLYPGMNFLRLNEESFDYGSNRYLGKLSDRFSNGSAIRCHQVNKDCESIGENRCEECRYGWYEVVDYQCPQGGSKFCGQNHCGEKNEPACPRGIKAEEAEDIGICQSDLEPVLNADKILVCQ